MTTATTMPTVAAVTAVTILTPLRALAGGGSDCDGCSGWLGQSVSLTNGDPRYKIHMPFGNSAGVNHNYPGAASPTGPVACAPTVRGIPRASRRCLPRLAGFFGFLT
jgi:hypothetical protein